VFEISKKYKGFKAGPENGERGYFLTFMIAYLRDFAMKFQYIAESFETGVSWKNVPAVCESVQRRIVDECKSKGKEPFISFRISQVYDTGATIYVYFGFDYRGINDPVGFFG
jgi:alkyldihydroxyacetonephosphate synthase